MSGPEVLPDLDSVVLKRGSHVTRADGVCAMELVAWLAGEPHTDLPSSACRALTTFVTVWNDAIQDDQRRTQILRPFISQLVNTRASNNDSLARRARLAADWVVRVQLPAWLDHAPRLSLHAANIRALEPIMSRKTCTNALQAVRAAKREISLPGDQREIELAPPDTAAGIEATALLAAWRTAIYVKTIKRPSLGMETTALLTLVDEAKDAAWAAGLAAAAAGSNLEPTIMRLQDSAAELLADMISPRVGLEKAAR